MWQLKSVGYQIYIKSFYDANNDGIGDLIGIYEKLDYLNYLGVNLIWITPFYESPMDDNGYDVSDFFKVDKIYGNLNDFKMILKKAKSLNMKVIIDFVLNHTSDEHPWFLESRKDKNNKYRDYYIWGTPKTIDGEKMPPTNWGSFFGGSAWEYDKNTDEYYMKIFSKKMPDLNWENDNVLNEFIKIGKFWLDLGVDGFRMDAISHLEKAPFVDSTYSKDVVLDWHKFSNLPKVHHYIKELNEKLFKPYNAFTIGEVGGEASIDEAIKYSSFKSNELSMVFNFDHNWQNNLHEIINYNDLKTNVKGLKEILNKWQQHFKNIGILPLNWLNHDQPRVVSHYGNINYHEKSAKMLATLMYLKRGMPFIYQGEEIGMTNYPFSNIDEFNDISTINRYYEEIKKHPNKKEDILKDVSKTSRDHPRTMMQWDNTKYAGFSKNKPWFLVNPNKDSINVKEQLENKNSILHYYKKIIYLRRFSKYQDIIVNGDYNLLEFNNDNIFSYIRKHEEKTLIVITSFSTNKETINLNDYIIDEVIINNYEDVLINNNKLTLHPYQAIAYIIKEIKI